MVGSRSVEGEVALRRPEQVLLLIERLVLAADSQGVIALIPEQIVAHHPGVRDVVPGPRGVVDRCVDHTLKSDVRDAVRTVVREQLRNVEVGRPLEVPRGCQCQGLALEAEGGFVHHSRTDRRCPLEVVHLGRVGEQSADGRVRLTAPQRGGEILGHGIGDKPEEDLVSLVDVVIDPQDLFMDIERLCAHAGEKAVRGCR